MIKKNTIPDQTRPENTRQYKATQYSAIQYTIIYQKDTVTYSRSQKVGNLIASILKSKA